jgi:hypothetical protein
MDFLKAAGVPQIAEVPAHIGKDGRFVSLAPLAERLENLERETHCNFLGTVKLLARSPNARTPTGPLLGATLSC